MRAVHVAVLLVNMVVALAYFVVEGGKAGGSAAATTFGLSIIYVLVLAPCGYVCWFRPLYKAFKTDSSLNFFLFFFIFAAWFFLMIVFCIGFDGYGAMYPIYLAFSLDLLSDWSAVKSKSKSACNYSTMSILLVQC